MKEVGVRLTECRAGRNYRRHFEQYPKLRIQNLNAAPCPHCFSHPGYVVCKSLLLEKLHLALRIHFPPSEPFFISVIHLFCMAYVYFHQTQLINQVYPDLPYLNMVHVNFRIPLLYSPCIPPPPFFCLEKMEIDTGLVGILFSFPFFISLSVCFTLWEFSSAFSVAY